MRTGTPQAAADAASRPAAAWPAVVLAAALSAFAGAQFDRLFVGHPVVAPVVVAAVVAAALATLLRWWRLPLWLATVVQVVVGVVVLGAVVFNASTVTGLPTPTSVHALYEGLVDGWARLLSTTLPAKAAPHLVVMAPALTWIATVLSVEATVRSRARVLALLPAVIVAGLAMAFTASLGYHRAVVAAVFVAVAAAYLGARDLQERAQRAAPPTAERASAVAAAGRRVVARRAAAALPVLAAVAVLGSVVGGALPFGHARPPLDARRLYDPPVHPNAATDPLARLNAYLSDRANPVLMTVATPKRDRQARWRWLILDGYDGTSWSSSAGYVDTGQVLPAPDEPAQLGPTRTVTARLHVRDLPGPWVPSLRSPIRLSATGYLVQPGPNQLLAADGSAAGTTLTVRSLRWPEPTARQVQGAVPDPSAQAERVVQPAAFRRRLLAKAQQLTSGMSTAYGQLAALRQWFTSTGGFTYDRDAPPGEGAAQLTYFLFGDTAHPHGTRRGTPEQFASSYALMARALGYPARVVVGFQAGGDSYDAARGAYILRAHDLYAWVEVDFAGLGWVRIDPTPPLSGSEKTKADDDPVSRAQKLAQHRPSGGSVNPHHRGSSPVAGVAAPGGGTSAWAVAARVVLACLALVLLEALALAALRLRRRRRRRGLADASAAVVAAWHEVLDALAALWPGGVRAMSAPEVVRAAGAVVGPDEAAPLRPLGSLVEGALYGGVRPDDASVERSWSTAERFAGAVRARRGWRSRVWAWFNPLGFLPGRWSSAVRRP